MPSNSRNPLPAPNSCQSSQQETRGCNLSSAFQGPCRPKGRLTSLELIPCIFASFSETSHRWAQPDTAPVSVPADIRFSIWISFFEIYNELLYDLLEPPSQQRKRQTLRLCEDQNGNPYVKGMDGKAGRLA